MLYFLFYDYVRKYSWEICTESTKGVKESSVHNLLSNAPEEQLNVIANEAIIKSW